MEILNNQKSHLAKAVLVLVVIVSLYFAMKTIIEVKNYGNMPSGSMAVNTITLNGEGEVSATPDIATVHLTLKEEAKEMKDAQAEVTVKEKAVLDFLDKSDIAKKDIKTESYSSFPKYDYGVPCYGGMGIPCRQDAPRIIGYEVSESITIKIRDIAKTGEIVKGIGALGISEIIGPNFSIEKEEELKAEARKLAIEEAQEKAEVLAKDLGVRLVRVVNFYENGDYGMPMYAKDTSMLYGSARSEVAPSPALPTGENKIISNVSITYEIR